MSNSFISSASLNAENVPKAFIISPPSENDEFDVKSPVFVDKELLLKDLFSPSEFMPYSNSENSISEEVQQKSTFSDIVVLKNWKNIENFPGRVIEVNDEYVVLECLVDKENRIYEERIFKKSLFNNYNLKETEYFYLRLFERQNEMLFQIHNTPGLILESDFPKLDFVKEFSKSKLFKKKPK